MQQKVADDLIEKITAAQGVIQNMLQVECSISDISELPAQIVAKCGEFWNWLEVWNTKLKAEYGSPEEIEMERTSRDEAERA